MSEQPQAKLCEFCKVEFKQKSIPRMEPNWNRRRFCSVACAAKHRYRNAPLSKSLIYRKAARSIPLGSACQHCGRSEVSLDKHHIDENPLNNDPENVMTLCDSCHTKLHWRLGKKRNPRASCSVCGKPASRRGYCQKHWFRFAKYGNPLTTKKSLGPGKFALVQVSPND
jgi:5-methylcytosine-specific restriction endonuclease McrA